MIAHLFRLCLFVAGCACAEELQLPDLDSKLHSPLAAEARPTVLFFVSPFCPTVRSFMPEILAIAENHAGQARFYLIHSDPAVTPEIALQHANLFQVKLPVLLDREQKLAVRTGARVTPEAVVLVGGEVRYRGRINDLYLGPTKRQRASRLPTSRPRRARSAGSAGNRPAAPAGLRN